MIAVAEVQELVGRWWFSYDAAAFDALRNLLTDDATFVCRTDTGNAEWEEFVRADLHGADEVMAWMTEHRLGSPDPLRHNAANVHLTDRSDTQAAFESYIAVTQIVAGMPSPLSSGIVRGVARDEGDGLRIAELQLILDTLESVPLSDRQ
jgi:hypothetical protein